jgi:N-methylhydantoinase B/oxoprolinase/acetone carboxylase alpha subunit
MYKSDLLYHRLPGGGGWGNPFERDPEAVLRDVMNKKVSLESARRDYGVIIEIDPYCVSPDETKALRESRRMEEKGGEI